MTKSDFYWLCGYLEGEGSFMKGPPSRPQYPVLSATSTDEDIIQRVGQLLNVSYCSVTKRKAHWRQSHTLRIHGRKAVELMKEMRPQMSQRRQMQIDAAVASYERRPMRGSSKLTDEKIREIKRLIREGVSTRQIAASVPCSTWSVNRIKNHGAFAYIQ
jgi:DNA-binding NarL/FixJ family response regulator